MASPDMGYVSFLDCQCDAMTENIGVVLGGPEVVIHDVLLQTWKAENDICPTHSPQHDPAWGGGLTNTRFYTQYI